jgi:hypothetical protein
MRVLIENLMHCGGRQRHHQSVIDSSYTDLLAMIPPTFTEADNWLRIIESKFGLLHCIEFQKTLYAA